MIKTWISVTLEISLIFQARNRSFKKNSGNDQHYFPYLALMEAFAPVVSTARFESLEPRFEAENEFEASFFLDEPEICIHSIIVFKF